MSFINELEKGTNHYVLTENGAITNASALDANLDYFALAGAMRKRVGDTRDLFSKAFSSNKLTALRTLFYIRDIRGGQGERDVFRAGLEAIEKLDRSLAMRIVENDWIGEYGRYDDLFTFKTPEVMQAIVDFIDKRLTADEAAMKEGKSVSLLAKWLPSENTSSKESVKLARLITTNLGVKPSQYRKRIVALRKYIKLLEQQMSSNEWAEINYSKLPSQAGRKHVKAFMRHDEKRYRDFLGKVQKGEAKINTGTLFTYEIYDMVQSGSEETADAMWKNLPDYTRGSNALVMADVSGSMTGRPMSVSVSLALYFAERNQGPFKDYYMTFSGTPVLTKVVGNTIEEKFRFVERHNVGYNTDLAKAFDAILNAAIKSGAKGDDMPRILYIISDMEFDDQMSNCGETNFETAQRKFKEAGLELPHVVFWNVDARQNQAPATKFDNRVTLLSGCNQSTFKYAVEGKTPVEFMNEVVNGERYSKITLDDKVDLDKIPF